MTSVSTADLPVRRDGPRARHAPQTDPWGILVVGSPRAPVAPLCSEAGRLGFEVFRCRELKPEDRSRLRSADWAAGVIVCDNLGAPSTTPSMIDAHLPPNVPLVWMGAAPDDLTHQIHPLPTDCPQEAIAAEVFHQARNHLYPRSLVRHIRAGVRNVLGAWGEHGLLDGPVWIKNHFTPPFALTAMLNLYGDVSGELVVSGAREWFAQQASAGRTVEQVAAEIGSALLTQVMGQLEAKGADLSMGPAVIVEGSTPVHRRLSHRPALCFEFGTRSGELMVVEFSGTGLDALDLDD